jgi:CheY-like chemotaxis protein
MPKRVLDVGNCSMDHGSIRDFLEGVFGAEVVQAHGPDDAHQLLGRGHFDLVLVNRKLDQDYSDGLEIIKAIKADAKHAHVPCMLITNYPEHQESAVAAGAEPGFGKKQLRDEATRAKLERFLK